MLPCNNIKCRYYKNVKDIDYVGSLDLGYGVPRITLKTEYVSQGQCKYNYCKIRTKAKRR